MKCENCHKEFFQVKSSQKFCNADCRMESFLSKKGPKGKSGYDRECRQCKSSFFTSDTRKLTCSPECNVKYQNARRETTQLVDRPCIICRKLFKPLQKRGIGRQWCSEDCKKIHRLRYWPEKQKRAKEKRSNKVYQRQYTEINREKTVELLRRKDLKKKYNITLEQYNEMLANQKGVCAVCGEPETAIQNGKVRNLAVDHDHETGKIRALLCTNCNLAVGSVKESIDRTNKVAQYLKEHKS